LVLYPPESPGFNPGEQSIEQGWSYRRIARELGVDRDTVARYDRLRRNRSNPAIVTPGSEASTDPNAAISTAGSGSFLTDLVFIEASARPPGSCHFSHSLFLSGLSGPWLAGRK
jgi:hypothetical protein